MDKKIKFDWNAFWIIGLVFTLLGSIFTALGIIITVSVPEMDYMFLLCFSGIGMIFLVLGIIFLITQIIKRSHMKRVVEEGNYILAEIMEVYPDYSVRVNGRCPYIVRCKYEDGSGTVHTFKSRGLFFNPESMFTDQFVRVYVNRDNYKYYYVDIDSVLPRIQNH